jgi:hypothetical protein
VAGELQSALILSLITAVRQLSFCESMISLSFFGSALATLTPISENGLPSRFLTSDRSWGQLALQVIQYSDQK